MKRATMIKLDRHLATYRAGVKATDERPLIVINIYQHNGAYLMRCEGFDDLVKIDIKSLEEAISKKEVLGDKTKNV